MQCGLFSMFDPVCSLPVFGSGNFKWFLILPALLFLPLQVGALPCGSVVLKKIVLLSLVKDLLPSNLRRVSVIFVSVFVVIFMVNASSLSPVCYAPSAHPGFIFPLSMLLFLPSVVGWLTSKGVRSFMAHLLPGGSPASLWGFLVLVETVSLWIRPVTLSIRLVANIMAGHIFIEMLANLAASFPPLIFLVPGFLGFEAAVSLVQALVFTNLLALFWAEQFESH